jgi:antibiotic biosynthesis monooxygenase (ABM) superfamily enzyme
LAGRTTLSVRYKMTVVILTALMLVFLGLNFWLAMSVSDPTPAQSNLIDNASRAWQMLLAVIAGFFGGKAL